MPSRKPRVPIDPTLGRVRPPAPDAPLGRYVAVRGEEARRMVVSAFAPNCVARRKRAKITQSQLADAIGVNINTLSRIERGVQAALSLATAAAIARVLGTTVDALMPVETLPLVDRPVEQHKPVVVETTPAPVVATVKDSLTVRRNKATSKESLQVRRKRALPLKKLKRPKGLGGDSE